MRSTLFRLLIGAVAPLVLALPALPAAAAPAPDLPGAGERRAGWALKFRDDFGSRSTSQAKWFNSAPRPLETRRCWDFGRSSGQSVVMIKPRKRWDPPSPGEWAPLSCRMRTHKEFGGGTYKFSARVKFHRATGTLSSFWVTGAGANGANEIDVIENTGQKSRKTCVLKRDKRVSRDDESSPGFRGLMQNVYHVYEPRTGHRNCVRKARADNLYDGRFHVVTAIWRPRRTVDFLIDGHRVSRFGKRWSRTYPVHALLTNKTADPSGAPRFVVDWVKIWKRR